jgi:hypothetical protein
MAITESTSAMGCNAAQLATWSRQQERQVPKLGTRNGRVRPVEGSRTHQKQLFLDEEFFLHYCAGANPVEDDRQIQATRVEPLLHIRADALHQLQVNSGMAFTSPGKNRNGQCGTDGRGDTQDHRAAEHLTHAAHILLGMLHQRLDAVPMFNHALALGCEARATPGPVQQTNAEVTFKLGDVLAQQGLGNRQLCGGFREILEAGNRHEGLDFLELHKDTITNAVSPVDRGLEWADRNPTPLVDIAR